MDSKYLVYDLLEPKAQDAANLRRMWAVIKKQRCNYEFRRKLAHDYWVAKCAKVREDERAS